MTKSSHEPPREPVRLHWYELHKSYPDAQEPIIERFFVKENTDRGGVAAKKALVERITLVRIVDPEAVLKAYVMTRERLDWVS